MARARSIIAPCLVLAVAAAFILGSTFVPAPGADARAPAATAVAVASALLGATPAFAESDPETSFGLGSTIFAAFPIFLFVAFSNLLSQSKKGR
eukprot:CAMPEP_0203876740 /NCGR_PEP_ID=MMETSP0359-20131031/21501_1 /ASSEMBLY_ACC=CAM_ASM_000338 /TAXON_ID=268821 /ORGANISM="Scrippsiella Hangoei, Strain SHTV-5" /LENGTH=93 /DNA_ID=CAMNT_0050795599 /DNA_START=62 /DNA_END=343 /DNA_ORIENTATION=-